MATSETVEVYLHTSSISVLVGGVSDYFHVRPATSAWTAGRVGRELELDAWRRRKIASMLGIERRSPHQKTQYWTLRMLAANAVSSTGGRSVNKTETETQECPQQDSLPVTRWANAAAR
jgi:hypothetical protein